MLSQESGDFQVFLRGRSRRGTTLVVELAASTLAGRRNPGSPCHTGFNGAACGRIIGHLGPRLGARLSLLGTQIETYIRGKALEQGSGIARLGVVTFLRFL